MIVPSLAAVGKLGSILRKSRRSPQERERLVLSAETDIRPTVGPRLPVGHYTQLLAQGVAVDCATEFPCDFALQQLRCTDGELDKFRPTVHVGLRGVTDIAKAVLTPKRISHLGQSHEFIERGEEIAEKLLQNCRAIMGVVHPDHVPDLAETNCIDGGRHV